MNEEAEADVQFVLNDILSNSCYGHNIYNDYLKWVPIFKQKMKKDKIDLQKLANEYNEKISFLGIPPIWYNKLLGKKMCDQL